MAEAIAFDVVTNKLIKLKDVFREICLVYRVDDDLKKLEKTLIAINAFLLDADRRQEESQEMKDWISKLNEVVYDADDVLDAFNTKNLQQRQLNIDGRAKVQVCEFFQSSKKLAFRYKMGREMKKIRERLDEIVRSRTMSINFTVTERVIDRARVGGGSYRDTTSYVQESYVIGREKEKEEIINMLMCSSNEEKVSIVSIVGIGGLGKTTLAQSVYCDKRVDNHFQLKIWVCVSEDFTKMSLVRNILISITNDEGGNLDMEQLQGKLQRYIDGKRYLLILDDIWNEDREKWIDVKSFLEGGAQGSKILVTTRSTKVSSAMNAENTYILKSLTEEQSWSLFKKVAFRGHEEVHAYMESIGKEIIIRCKGVPLAIWSLGSVMQSKTKESDWSNIRNSDIWSSLENNSSILPILKLSYDHLPFHLKQCFAYCSIFPKDHTLDKDLLVQLWMAQCYIQSFGDESRDLEDIGDQYFEDLIAISFLQDVEVTPDTVICKMPDLIHDLALRVGGPRFCFIAENSPVKISEKVNHVSFGLLKNVPTKQLIRAKGLRTYFSTEDFGHWQSREQARPDKLLLSKLRRVRTLDLCRCGIEKLPNLVCKMQHLRFLNLSENREMKVLPNSITNLVNLQTLNLSGCFILKELPEGISKLLSLRHLIITGCSKISRMPRGLGKLTSLRTLSKFVVNGDKRSAKLRELNGLNNLRGYLHIANLKKVRNCRSESKEANLIGKQYLKSLSLKWGGDYFEEEIVVKDADKEDAEILLEGLQPHPNLKELAIEGYYGVRFPSWITSLPCIVEITFAGCPSIRHLPPFHQLPCLKTLHLLNLPEVEYNDGSSSSSSFSPSFPCLTHLQINNCPKLTSMPCPPLLEKLEIFSCPKLTSMPSPPHLETLVLERVSQKLLCQLLTTTTTTTASTSSPLSRLTDLSIWDMEGTESFTFFPEGVPQNLTSLKNLSIQLCPTLLHLAVSGEIQHLTALEDLQIFGCKELDLTYDGMNWRGLRSLRNIVIENIPKLVRLPEGLQHITTLENLTIRDCEELDLTHDDGMSWQGLRSLRNMEIEGIPKLVRLPEGFQHIITLESVDIQNCPGLVELPPFHQLPCLKTLTLSELPKVKFDDGSSSSSFSPSIPCLNTLNLSKLPKVEFDDGSSSSSFSPSIPCLTHLTVSHCPKLTSMPCLPLLETLKLERVSHKLLCQLLTTTTIAATSSPLSKLRSISIRGLEDSESLPFFPEGVPQNLTSLEKLEIRNCPGLSHLAVSGEIQHLTALEDLTIRDCKELDFTDDGMNWQGLRSLRKIVIWSIPKLVSLPEGLQHLVALVSLPEQLQHLTLEDIEKLRKLVSLPEQFQHLTREDIEKLDTRKLVSLPEQFQHLTLEDLQKVRDIRKLVSLPEGLKQITTTLQSFKIWNCPALVDLPDWTRNLPKISRL